MGYTHLTMEEREIIAQNLAAGHSIPRIAKQLGRNASTIYRELNRNTLASGRYSPCGAQGAYLERLQAATPPWRLEADPALRRAVLAGLAKRWSPQQIAGRLRRQHPRGRLGDFESDTLCAGRRPMMVTHVDRKSRYLVAAPLHDGHAAHLNRVTLAAFRKVPARRRHTLTVDNGREFSAHRALEKALGARIYFAPPYQCWQRATCENTNGLLREFFPKRARMRPTRKQVDRAVAMLNNRPRKCLGWRTPAEVFGAPG
jgi:IS30 family transposase